MEAIIGAKPASGGGWIKDSDTAHFMADVIDAWPALPEAARAEVVAMIQAAVSSDYRP